MNGWKNYETWKLATEILNTESLYLRYKNKSSEFIQTDYNLNGVDIDWNEISDSLKD